MTTAKLVAVVAISALCSYAAQAEPLKIGVIESLSGPQVSTGRPYAEAVGYVVDQLNAAGGYNGEPIQITEFDNGGTSTGASDKFKQASADGVHVVMQGASSAIAGQLTEDVRRHNLRNPSKPVLYINFGAEALELTGEKCHFYHFRFATAAPMRVSALVDTMKQAGTLGTRVYSINQNYSWGRDMEAAIVGHAEKGGYTVVGKVLHDVNKIQDFAPYVARIKDANPDTVITGNWSNDLLLLMKATGEAGLKVRFATTFLDQVGNIANAGETAVGHFVAHPGNIELDKTGFPEAYKAKTGHFPVFIEPQAVYAVRALGEALKATSSAGARVNAKVIAAALENVSIETPAGPVTIRKEDHQALMPIIVSVVTSDGVRYPVDGTKYGFKPIRVLPGKEAVYPVQSSCTMQRPS
jgi:branched-chain amino acid transport system substrate-binding protein